MDESHESTTIDTNFASVLSFIRSLKQGNILKKYTKVFGRIIRSRVENCWKIEIDANAGASTIYE